MISRWTVVEKAVKNMSTVHPNFLLKDKSRQGFVLFVNKLKEEKHNLLGDYLSYIAPTFPIGEDTECGICVRYSHRVAWLALCRLINALENLPESPSVDDIHLYFSRLFIPSARVYHHPSVVVAADLIHEMFNYSALLHLKDLPPTTSTNVSALIPSQCRHTEEDVFTDADPENAPFFARLKEINELLEYAAIIDSYPVVPEDIAGTLVPTLQRRRHVDLSVLSPGVDNRSYADRPRDPRVCVSCKVDNVNIGLIDVEEQDTKRPCQCIFDTGTYMSGRFYDKAYVCRGTAIVRLLLLNKAVFTNGLGCNCHDHNDVFTERLGVLKLALDAAKISQ